MKILSTSSKPSPFQKQQASFTKVQTHRSGTQDRAGIEPAIGRCASGARARSGGMLKPFEVKFGLGTCKRFLYKKQSYPSRMAGLFFSALALRNPLWHNLECSQKGGNSYNVSSC